MTSRFPCEADLDLYTAKTLPRWAHSMRERTRDKQPDSWHRTDLIDIAINAHAGIRPTSGECSAHNIMAMIAKLNRIPACPASALAARLNDLANSYEAQAICRLR